MMMNLLKRLRARREQERLALIAQAASLVIQQHSQQWERVRPCPNCTQFVSETANFCQMCGYSFVPELQPEPEPVAPAQPVYEIERHTEGILYIPKRPMPPPARITSLIRTQDLPTFKKGQ